MLQEVNLLVLLKRYQFKKICVKGLIAIFVELLYAAHYLSLPSIHSKIYYDEEDFTRILKFNRLLIDRVNFKSGLKLM